MKLPCRVKPMGTDQPKKQPRRKSSDKTAAILDGAMQEFMAYGYAAASMDRIAIAAGVSKPTLYSYFTDKEGLFTALVHQLSESDPLLGLQDAALLAAPPKVFLRYLATNVLDRFSGNEPFFTLIRLLLGESGRFPELAQSFVRQVQKPVVTRLTLYFTHHPNLHLPDPEVAARMFMGTLMHYIIMQEILQSGDILPIDRDRLIDGLVDTLTTRS